jgi:type IV secretion system protein VirD4
MSVLAGAGAVVGLAALAVTAVADKAAPGRGGSRGGTRIGARRPAPPPPGRRALPPPGRGGLVARLRVGGWGRPTQPERSAHWAGGGDLRSLAYATDGRPAPPGRLVLGWAGRRLVAAERNQSVIVFGPTQSRKTSGFAVPAILGWEGPVLATSVKADLVGDTVAHRRRCGTVTCFDPTGATGLPSAWWSPLPGSRTWPGARRAASSLTEGGRVSAGSLSDGDFWLATATKLLAPLLLAAATGDLAMADVVRWVDTQEETEVLELLGVAGVPEAVNAALAAFGKDERQRSSTYTTAETVLEPFADQVEDTGDQVQPAALVSGQHTLYLCAPTHDQRRLSPLFTAVVRQVLEHVYDTVTRTGHPIDPPLLVVLDEAANIAPLSDLDALASTAAGHGVQLVTVWHDLAQLTARFGPRAPTVVNNHRAKVFLSGISDPSTLDHASHLIGDEEVLLPVVSSGAQNGRSVTRSPSVRRLAPPDWLRRIPTGEGVLVYGGLPPTRLRLRTWFDDPELAARASAGTRAAVSSEEVGRPAGRPGPGSDRRWRRARRSGCRGSDR